MLKEDYKGVGVYSINVEKAKLMIKNLHYSGEKKPHMWWGRFDCGLQWAYTDIDNEESRLLYSKEQKLQILLDKGNADFFISYQSKSGD